MNQEGVHGGTISGRSDLGLMNGPMTVEEYCRYGLGDGLAAISLL